MRTAKEGNWSPLLDTRTKSLDGSRWAYKLTETGGSYGLDVIIDDSEPEINESEMSIVIPFASGVRRDGVGDLLEIGGIRTERHVKNPVVLWNHGKEVQLPIGMAENPKTGEYTVYLDVMGRCGKLKAYLYQGGDRQHALFAEQVFDLWAKKFIRGGSIGYQVIRAEQIPPDYATGTPQGLHLKETLMLEGSAVVMPANMDTVGKSLSYWDPSREVLCMNGVCGYPLSAVLKKSFEDVALPKKAMMGWEGKSLGDKKDCPCGCGGNCGCSSEQEVPFTENLSDTHIPPPRWTPGWGAKELSAARAHYRAKMMVRRRQPGGGKPIKPPCINCGRNRGEVMVVDDAEPNTGEGYACPDCVSKVEGTRGVEKEAMRQEAARIRKENTPPRPQTTVKVPRPAQKSAPPPGGGPAAVPATAGERARHAAVQMQAQRAARSPKIVSGGHSAGHVAPPHAINATGRVASTGRKTPKIDKAMPSSGVSPEKACLILKDGEANGHPLTEKQRGMFGAACGRSEKGFKSLRAFYRSKAAGEIVGDWNWLQDEASEHGALGKGMSPGNKDKERTMSQTSLVHRKPGDNGPNSYDSSSGSGRESARSSKQTGHPSYRSGAVERERVHKPSDKLVRRAAENKNGDDMETDEKAAPEGNRSWRAIQKVEGRPEGDGGQGRGHIGQTHVRIMGERQEGKPYKPARAARRDEGVTREKDADAMETDEKSLKSLRRRYRAAKGLMRVLRKSVPGSFLMRVRGKDIKACREMAARMGLKFVQGANITPDEYKVKLVGDKGAASALAGEYAVGGGFKSLTNHGCLRPDQSGKERASLENATLANSRGGTETVLPECKSAPGMEPEGGEEEAVALYREESAKHEGRQRFSHNAQRGTPYVRTPKKGKVAVPKHKPAVPTDGGTKAMPPGNKDPGMTQHGDREESVNTEAWDAIRAPVPPRRPGPERNPNNTADAPANVTHRMDRGRKKPVRSTKKPPVTPANTRTNRGIKAMPTDTEDVVIDVEKLPAEAADLMEEEPLGAQLLRRVHEDRVHLFQEYHAYLKHCEEPNVRKLVENLLATMDSEMTAIEKFFAKHPDYKELPPLEGADTGEDMETEGAAPEFGEESEEGAEEGGEIGLEGEAPEEEALETPEEEAAEQGEAGEEAPEFGNESGEEAEESAEDEELEEPTGDEVVEGMQGEGAGKRGKKTLNGEMAKALKFYRRMKGMCPECGMDPCICGQDKPTEPGNEEFQEKPGEAGDPTPDINPGDEEHQAKPAGVYLPHHHEHVAGAVKFLGKISKAGHMEEPDRLESWHHHKNCESIVGHLDGKGLGEMVAGAVGMGSMGEKAKLDISAEASPEDMAGAGKLAGALGALSMEVPNTKGGAFDDLKVKGMDDNPDHGNEDLRKEPVDTAGHEPGFEEIAENEADPQATKYANHRQKFSDASSYLRDLAMTPVGDFNEEHRRGAVKHETELNPMLQEMEADMGLDRGPLDNAQASVEVGTKSAPPGNRSWRTVQKVEKPEKEVVRRASSPPRPRDTGGERVIGEGRRQQFRLSGDKKSKKSSDDMEVDEKALAELKALAEQSTTGMKALNQKMIALAGNLSGKG